MAAATIEWYRKGGFAESGEQPLELAVPPGFCPRSAYQPAKAEKLGQQLGWDFLWVEQLP